MRDRLNGYMAARRGLPDSEGIFNSPVEREYLDTDWAVTLPRSELKLSSSPGKPKHPVTE